MKKKLLTTMIALVFLNAFAQERCGTVKNWEKRLAEHPELQSKIENSERRTQNWIAKQKNSRQFTDITTIPVVVHVIWNDPVENISNEQIQTQIDVLNEDFSLTNSNALSISHPFYSTTADTKIQFTLAKQDPEGNATEGITRTNTTKTSFDGNNEEEKFTSQGGHDGWDPTKYLNIWVCNLDDSGGVLGYATPPSQLDFFPQYDGVVIRYQSFGTTGTATAPFNLGRTATHEVGHWLNLEHIWGDATCGDDKVDDTVTAKEDNYGCPTFPHNANSSCGADSNGEMYMNYMDYTDDSCMNMFTNGQALRMQAALAGDRSGILTSQGGQYPLNSNEFISDANVKIAPNPSSGIFTVTIGNTQSNTTNIEVYNQSGALTKHAEYISKNKFEIDLKELANGIYFLKVINAGNTITRKIIISK